MDEDHQKRKTTVSLDEEPPDKKLKCDNSVETIYSQDKSILDNWDAEGAEGRSSSTSETGSQENTNQTAKNLKSEDDTFSTPNGSSSTKTCQNKVDNCNDIKSKVDLKKNSPTGASSTEDSVDEASNKKTESQNRDEAGKKIKWDCGRHFSDQTDQGSSETLVEETRQKINVHDENTSPEPIVPPEEPIREKCAYGNSCYRRNRSHKRQFSHPGDPDWDIPDTRPECPYGLRCYRKNPQHKKDFKHTKTHRSRAQTPIRGNASDATSGTEVSSAEESVDESDWEPSYCTSDDYRSDLEGLSDFDGISDTEDGK